jgi:hypothetical protein
MKEEVTCSICKKQLNLDEVHYIGFWRKGLYKDYVEVIPVCKDDLPRKRRVIATVSVLSEKAKE